MKIKLNPNQEIANMKRNMAFRWMESEADPGWGGLYESDIFFEIILTNFIKIDMMVLTSKLGICKGCFTGKYPMEPPAEDIRGDFDK